MKTIEERADEYASRAWSALNEEFNEDHTIFENIVSAAFVAGAKSEMEDLARWRCPKKELPENSMRVIVCAQLPNGARLITGGWYGADPGEIGWNIDIDWKELEVIGWRPI